jgi:hypothetical protein
VTTPIRWGLLSTALINGKLIAGARAAIGVELVAVATHFGFHGAGTGRAEPLGTTPMSVPISRRIETDPRRAVCAPINRWTRAQLESPRNVGLELPLVPPLQAGGHRFDPGWLHLGSAYK